MRHVGLVQFLGRPQAGKVAPTGEIVPSQRPTARADSPRLGKNAAYSHANTAQSIGRSPIAGTTGPVAARAPGEANAALHESTQPRPATHESSVKTRRPPRAASKPSRAEPTHVGPPGANEDDAVRDLDRRRGPIFVGDDDDLDASLVASLTDRGQGPGDRGGRVARGDDHTQSGRGDAVHSTLSRLGPPPRTYPIISPIAPTVKKSSTRGLAARNRPRWRLLVRTVRVTRAVNRTGRAAEPME